MQSSSQIITTNKPTSNFLQAGCPTRRQTNKALKGKVSHSMDMLTPSSSGGLPTLSLATNSSWLPWGRVVMPLISPLMPVHHTFIPNHHNVKPFITHTLTHNDRSLDHSHHMIQSINKQNKLYYSH